MKVVRSLIFCAMAALVSSLAFAMGQVPTGASDGSLIGKVAYDVRLPTAAGGQMSIAQACAGKKAVIFFWATWCPHCHDEIMRMVPNLDAITAKGIKIVLVSEGEKRADVAAYLKNNNVPLDSLLDEDGVLQGPYQLSGVPTLFFVDEKGMIRSMDHGFPDNYEEMFTAP